MHCSISQFDFKGIGGDDDDWQTVFLEFELGKLNDRSKIGLLTKLQIQIRF